MGQSQNVMVQSQSVMEKNSNRMGQNVTINIFIKYSTCDFLINHKTLYQLYQLKKLLY